LGDIIVRKGFLTKEQIDATLEKLEKNTRIGTALMQAGLITSHTLFNLIQLQIREIIYSTFVWTEGNYAFSYEDMAGKEMIKNQTRSADLVLGGIERHYSTDRLLGQLVSKERVLEKNKNPAFALAHLHLGTLQNYTLQSINGRKNLEQILEQSKLEEKEALQLIYALLVMKVIQDKVLG